MASPVVAIGSIADTSVYSVSYDRAAANIRNVDPEMVVSFRFNGFVEGEERYTGLEETGVVLRVNIKYLVHAPAEVNENRPAYSRSCAAVTH